MGDGPSRADDESWTDVQDVQPELVEVLPIRHGMVLAGRYAIERIIGRGGSGVVVRAHDRDLRVAVAIKIVRAELAGQRVWAGRLAREVKLARQIHHPHVCRVFDFQQADGRVFLVMELAEKGTLRDEIRSGALAARPLAERIADARAVASALSAIHAAGIVHRDLSLQNLLRMDDGRLVLSDFGLAVDVSDSTSSVHGGTVAYMAPEVVRGDKASVASDIWALGVVMHEMVFGVKPRWGEEAGGEMLEPELGRRLTEEERAVLEACRACTAREPARRIASAAEASALLTERRPWRRWRRAIAGRRPVIWAVVMTLVAAGTVALVGWQRAGRVAPASKQDSPLIIPTGEAADWTDVSNVLVEVPDRIHCTRLLPDQRTIRFVWGTPPRAEDIDTVTRRCVRSPLVPAAYAEGCPDLSPDGKRLIFQGHTPEGRPFAFLSERPNGEHAVPIVQTAEPSMSSEPAWLADGQAFSYDIDTKHSGVFSLGVGHTTVAPEPVGQSVVTSFRFTVGDTIFVSAFLESGSAEVAAYSWPSFRELSRFRPDDLALDLRTEGPLILYTEVGGRRRRELIAFDRTAHTSRRLGRIRDQIIRYPTVVADKLVLASIRDSSDLYVAGTGGLTRVTASGDVSSAAHCGTSLVVAREADGRSFIERIDRQGKSLGVVIPGPWAASPQCSATGDVLYYTDATPSRRSIRCDQAGCRTLTDRSTISLAVSPDSKRIAGMETERRGNVIWWAPAAGGETHDVVETDSACHTGWASDKTLWISRRLLGKLMWTEVDADSGRETGKVMPGRHDCSDGRSDPGSPVDPDLRIVYDQTSQLRSISRQFLRQR